MSAMVMGDMPCDMAMPMADAGHGAPMAPCKGLTPECIKQMGCVANVALPIRLVDADDDPDLRLLNPWSLSELQDRFKNGGSPGFLSNRAVVLQHLSPQAFVTVRACRFGQSDEGMYALYSFFGGTVDVYAPLLYQFFGSVFLRPGMRYANRLTFHEHLVRQRFLPFGKHTPTRATTIVQAMETPQAFSEPFTLASMTVGGGEPPEYGALIDTLNAGQVSPALAAAFDQDEYPLSAQAKVIVRARDSEWIVGDTVQQDGDTFPVAYSVSEQVDLTAGRRSLVAQGTVVGDGAEVSLQLFLNDAADAELNGQVALLAFSVDGEPADSTNLVQFTALSTLLTANSPSGTTFSIGTIDLRAQLIALGAEFQLADAATIRVPNNGDVSLSNGLHRSLWLVGPTVAGTQLEIRLEQPYTPSRIQSHTIQLYRHFAPDPDGVNRQAAAWEAQVLATAGSDPDSPGVELAASLDHLSFDDLVDLITFLQQTYDPGTVVQLRHAHEALQRKAGFRDWLIARFPDATRIPFPSGDPLTELSLGQRDDLLERTYPFEFNGNWREVREFVTPKPVFEHDLFLEEDLIDRFPNVLNSWAELANLPDNSSSSSARDQQLQRTAAQHPWAATQTQKHTFTPPDLTSNCQSFRDAIKAIRQAQGLPIDQLTATLADQKTPEGESYLHIALGVAESYGMFQKLWTLSEMGEILKLPEIPGDTWEFGKTALKLASSALDWELGSTIIEFLEMDLVFTLPLYFFKHLIEVEAEGVEKNETFGRLTGMRTWLRELDVRTVSTPHLLDETLKIDLSGLSDDQVIAAYQTELDDGDHRRFMYFIAEFHAGFSEGAAFMQERMWLQILRSAEEATTAAIFATSLESCRLKVLLDEGLLDEAELRAYVIHQIVQQLLSRMRHV